MLTAPLPLIPSARTASAGLLAALAVPAAVLVALAVVAVVIPTASTASAGLLAAAPLVPGARARREDENDSWRSRG